MKNFLLIFAMSMAYFTGTAQSTTFSIGMNAIGFIGDDGETNANMGTSFALEAPLNNKLTLFGEIGAFKGSIVGIGIVGLKQKARNMRTGFNFYPKMANQGFFIGLNLGYTKVTYKSDSDIPPTSSIYPVPATYLGGGMQLGFKTNLSKRLTFGTSAAMNLGLAGEIDDARLIYNFGANLGYKF